MQGGRLGGHVVQTWGGGICGHQLVLKARQLVLKARQLVLKARQLVLKARQVHLGVHAPEAWMPQWHQHRLAGREACHLSPLTGRLGAHARTHFARRCAGGR
jgi:hypothetical protein